MSQIKQSIIDVVIPAHEKDVDTLNHCIEGIRRNIDSVRRIIVISKEKYTDQAEWFDEALFPFSYKEIAGLVKGAIGWHLQQLLKLYSPLAIPDISENILIVDSDTVFFRKVKFFSDNGLPLYNLSKDKNLEDSDFHQTTYRHIIKILPEIAEKLPEKFRNISGICHHMLFQKHIIEELFKRVENIDGTGDPFYKIFLKNSKIMCGVAEYNLYFYFLVSLHPQEYQIRILNYKNTSDFSLWKYRLRSKYDYCSFHSYMREEGAGIFSKQKNILIKKIQRIFCFENWNIGILDFPIHEILNIKPEITWIKSGEKLSFFADPFGFKIDSRKYLIFEDYSQMLKRGRISIAELKSDLTLVDKKIILDDKKHLSYPFVIKHDGRIYMICESYKSQKLSLYEIDQTDLTAKKIKDIFTNKKIVDPTVLYHEEKFWMFYTDGNSPDSRLHIAFANSLLDEFKEHSENPVKIDAYSSRPAGTPFIFNGQIYRPTQNCSKVYGGSIVINRIVELSEKTFQEEFVKEIKPNSDNSRCEGLHTLSAFGNQTLIDGKIKVFVFYKPLISLLRNLVRIFK